MQEVMEHYGMAILEIVETAGVFAILYNCLEAGGTVYELIVIFMEKICG